MKSPIAIWLSIAIVSLLIGIGMAEGMKGRNRLKALEDDSYVQQKELDVTAAYLRETNTQATANKININVLANDITAIYERLDKLEAVKAPACQCAKAVVANIQPSVCDYVCPKCGWKPRDDGAMNRADTCEPLVAATRIDAHECKSATKPAFVVPKPPAPPKIDTNPRPWRGQ